MDIDGVPEPSCSKRSNGNDPAEDEDNEMSVKRSRPDEMDVGAQHSNEFEFASVAGAQDSAMDYEMQASSAAGATGRMVEAESQPQEQQQPQQPQPQQQQPQQVPQPHQHHNGIIVHCPVHPHRVFGFRWGVRRPLAYYGRDP